MIGVSCCKSFHFYWWPPVWCCHHVEKLDNSFNDDNICHISIFLYFLVFQIPKMRLGSLLLLICVLMVISDYLSLWHFFGLNNTPEKNLWTFAEKWFWGSLYLSWKKPKVRHFRCWVRSVLPMASPLSRSLLSDVLEVKPVSGTFALWQRKIQRRR